MNLANLRSHGDVIIAALEASGIIVGDATEPEDAHGWAKDGRTHIAYAIAYPMPGTFDGTLADHDDDADVVFQVTCVGATRSAAQLIEDKVNAALLTPGALTIPGRSVLQVRLDIGGGIRRDDTVQPPVFISTPRYRLGTTPA